MEILENIQLLALTWVPRGETYDPQRKFEQHQYEIFVKWRSPAVRFEIYPELTLAGNIHYHGIVQVLDKIAWYKRLLPAMKKKGFVKIKQIDNLEKWYKYIKKEYEENQKIFNPIPLMNSNIPKRTKEKPTPDLDYGVFEKYIGTIIKGL